MIFTVGYMTREPVPDRRHTWRQKAHIIDSNSGVHTLYVDFGEYHDGRLAEVFVTMHKIGTTLRGALDSMARSISLALQSGTSPLEMAKMLRGQDYPPQGKVEAEGSTVTECTSIADYIGQEIEARYGEDGKKIVIEPHLPQSPADRTAGYKPDDWRSGV